MLETLCLTEAPCGDVQGFSAAAIKRSSVLVSSVEKS